MSQQHEILRSAPLLNASGDLAEPGWARSLLPVYRRSDIRVSPMRIKEWDYYLITDGHVGLALTIADNGYMGLDSISFLDFDEGWEQTKSPMRLFPMGKTGLPESSADGASEIARGGYAMAFYHEDDARCLTFHMDNFRGKDAIEGIVRLTDEPRESIVIATPFALLLGGGYGWLLNKIKGGEMMVATYVGFSSVSFMCMMWLLLPYKKPEMVWGFSGSGLRTTISLEGFYDRVLADILSIDLNRFGINLVIPTGSLIFFAILAFLMWAFLHTKTGTAMTAVGSNPSFAKAAGVSIDKMRLISVVLSTWLGAVGILVYEQGFGFIQIYTAPLKMAFPAVAAILIGGASVNKASIANVIIGTFLYQGLVTMTPTVINSLIHLDISEIIRIIVSNGMIVYALTRKMGGKK